MKINLIKIAIVTSLVLVGSQPGYSQGTFVNLDFESVIPPLNRDILFTVPISNALPGWTGYINGNHVDRVMYNGEGLGGPSISLESSLSPAYVPIQGSFSVYLKSSSDAGGTSAAISQTGQVPNDARSILFLRTPDSGFGVSFGGQPISLVPFGTSGNYIIMAGDISRFAGQTGQLLFAGGGLFDDIQFSNQAVPEPSVLGLSVIGGLLLAWRRWRNFSRP